MNTNGHTRSVRERLVSTLQLNGGQLPLKEVIFDFHFTRRQIDDEFEKAACPFGIRIRHSNNGCPKPATVVFLKNYTPPQAVSQEEVKRRLNAMTREEYLATIDPTFRLRHKKRAGGGARTSTSSDEYLNQNGDGFR